MSGKRIHGNSCRLPNRHVGELRLLIVGNYPYVRQGSQRRDLASDAHQLAGLDLALSDYTVLRCGDRRVLQVESGYDERGPSGGDGCVALCDLCFEDTELALRGLRLGSI